MHIQNIERTEPDSQILYRLKYRCQVVGQNTSEVFFAVELSPFGERAVHLESTGLSAATQEEIQKLLQDLADHDKLPR